ncbi:MAG: glutamyl-tRNA reductase [Deltaproteobacteria bacterium]|nr:glutamyl-tRNA reductase [Deltaproteobacteria bacterium]
MIRSMPGEKIIILGLNHDTAPVEVRERLAFSRSSLPESLKRLHSLSNIREGVIVSTCNRVEVIASALEDGAALKEIKHFLTEQELEADQAILDDHLYAYSGGEAVRHLFRVAASLDSMVVGEPQILGQLKEHYAAAHEAGTVGTLLHRLFHRAFSVAKRVRTETGIGGGFVSVSSVAVDLARRIFDRLDDKSVMLIGAGKMGALVVRHLQRNGVRSLMVTNRTFERAVELSAEFQGSPIRYEDFPRYLKLADVVIGSTGSPQVVVWPEAVIEALKERRQRPMFLIDLGVPRNFDARINEIDNVYVYNIDDLKGVADENLRERSSEAQKAEEIVTEEVTAFLRWLESLDQVPVIAALRRKLEEIRQAELEKSLGTSLKGLSEKERQAIEDMTTAMINKILHSPISCLKRGPAEKDGMMYVEALKKFFGLEEK